MFSRNRRSIYEALGDGKSLSEGVKIAVFKNGQLRSGLNTIVSDKIKTPNDVSNSEYFREGVVYTVIPTANENDFFALPSDVSRINENHASSLVRMIQLFSANEKESSDKALINERNSISREVDLSNTVQFIDAVNSIIYTNNKDDRYMFDLNLKNRTLNLGIDSNMQFKLDDIKTNKDGAADSVKDILSKRFYAVKLSDFGKRFTGFSVNENNNLILDSYKNYNDYLNDKSIITTRIQGEPIEGANKKYFTAQSVIEVSRPIQKGYIPSSIEESSTEYVEELFEDRSKTVERPKVKANPKNKLGTRIRPRRPNDISEDFSEILIDTTKSIDQQVEDLMNKCK